MNCLTSFPKSVIFCTQAFETGAAYFYKGYLMKTFFKFLICLLSLSFCIGCGEIENPDIEFGRNKVSTPEITLAFARTVYFLWPNEQNKRFIDEVLKDLPEYEDPAKFHPSGQPIDDGQLDKRVKERHAALLEKHGDIPEVDIVVRFEMKVRNNQPLTIDDVFAYRQARFKLEPDHEQNRVLLEAYLQAKANGEPLESVDERKVLEEWRKVEEE